MSSFTLGRRRRYLIFLLFVSAILIVRFLPDADSQILRVVKSAGLVLIVVRGLKGYYDDFSETLTRSGNEKAHTFRKKTRKSCPLVRRRVDPYGTADPEAASAAGAKSTDDSR